MTLIEVPVIYDLMNDTDTFIQDVAATMTRHAGNCTEERVLVAVSGGADSVALLLALHHLGYSLVVAHFDHLTRSGESTRDARFVEELAASLAVPCVSTQHPVESSAEQAGQSFEAFARKLRYDFFKEVAKAQECAVIATGHHADDVIETLLMRLLRGTSLRGLASIPPVRHWEGLRIVRPLWEQPRDRILAWLQQQGQPWCEDRTNQEIHYLRNRIRHELIPLLKDTYNPGLTSALSRLIVNLRRDNDFLEQSAQQALSRCVTPHGLSRADFRKEDRAMQYRLLALWCHELGIQELTSERLDTMVNAVAQPATTGEYLDTGGKHQLYIGRDHVLFLTPDSMKTDLSEVHNRADDTHHVLNEAGVGAGIVCKLNVPGITTVCGHIVHCHISTVNPTDNLAVFCHSGRQVFDADTVEYPLYLRHWQHGDVFQPLGMRGNKKLSDYFVDRGVPAPLRKRELLLVDSRHILWHVGGQPGANAAVHQKTQRWLIVEIHHEAE